MEPLCDAFDQSGLSGPEIAPQHYEFRRSKKQRKFATEGYGFLRRGRRKLANVAGYHHIAV